MRYYTIYGSIYLPYPGTEGSLAYSNNVYTETLDNGLTNYFDTNGKLTRVENAIGNYITIVYDQGIDNLETVVTDEFGRTVVLHHDTNGRVDWVQDPVGRVYNYTYDTSGESTNGNLESVEFPGGTTRNYYYGQYTAFPHKITSITINDGALERMVARWAYEETTGSDYGKAKFSSDGQAGGQDIDSVSLAFTNGTTVVTDSLGRDTAYVTSDINGIFKTTGLTGDCGCSKGSSEYDAFGNISLRVDESGNKTAYTDYDSKGNPGVITEKDAFDNILRVTRYTYNLATSAAKTITRTSAVPFGNYTTSATAYSYDGFNNLTGVVMTGNTKDIDGDGVHYSYASHYRYNSHGNITTSVDPRGHATAFGYYSSVWGAPEHGRLSSVTDALGHSVSFGNYSSGKPGRVIDANNVLTTSTYNARGMLKTVTVRQRTTSYGYDAFGNMTSMRLPTGNRIGYGYDAANRLERVSDGVGNYIKYTHDTESNRTREEIRDASGTLVKYRDMAYDADNRLRHTKLFGTYSTTMIYDPNGNLKEFTDYNRNTTSYRYDALGRMEAAVQPPARPEPGFGNISTVYTYDVNDNITTVTDGNGHATAYVYDDLGRLVEVSSPDTGMTRYEYDAAGNLLMKMDAKGVLVSYVYDALDRLTMIDYPGTGEDVTYSYDSTAGGNFGIGRMTGMTDPSGATAYYYDEYGEVIKEVRTFTGLPALTTEYTYDSNGNKETMTYPDGRVATYAYDNADRVSRVTSVKLGTVKIHADSITHTPFGPVSSYTYGNGFMAVRTYDMDYRLTHLKSGPMVRREYGYDNNGNITSIADLVHAEKSQSFTYDALNRLISATGAYGSLSYDYDAVGNRTKKTENGNVTNYFYAPGTNRLDYATGAEAATYTYDANGNMISDGKFTYEYSSGGIPLPANMNPTSAFESSLYPYTDSVGKPSGVQTNLYNFVGNNPVNAIDPLGLFPVMDPGTGGTYTYEEDGVYYDQYGSPIGEVGVEAPNPFLDPINYVGLGGGAGAVAAKNAAKIEANFFSKGNVCKIVSKRYKAGFRIDPAHHGKRWGHPHFWRW